MTNEEAKGRLESFIDTFNICKEHDNALVAVSIGKEDIQAFIQAINALSQQEKVAEWYGEDGCKGACEGYMSAGVICSQCGEVFCGYIGDYDFCPNCGARMVSK